MSLLRRTCTWYKWANVSPLDKQLSTFHQPTTFSAHVHLSKRQARRHSTVQNIPCEIPPSKLNTKSHRLGWEKIQTQVEPYFTTNWKFAGEKEKQGLLAVGLSRAFSNAFPLTLDNRIGVTCKMLYLSLLIDDQLEKMNFPQMLSYRHRIMGVVLGSYKPDISISREWILYDTFQIMRGMNKPLADDVARGFCHLLKAMTSQERASISNLEPYLEFREVDVGRTFFTALMRFGANIHLTKAQLSQTKALESTAFRHFSIINDIYSWEREWKVSQATLTDGAQPFSAVAILAKETSQPIPICKKSLYDYCRDLELGFKQDADGVRHNGSLELTPEMEKYLQSLEYFMSGMETWSQWTPRYRQ